MFHPRFFVVLIACAIALGLTACGGNSGTPPTITTQPQNQTVVFGMPAIFTVVASGSMPLTYQWMKNGMSIPGATAASYTTPPTTLADNNSMFAVVVSNNSGSVTSSAATLTVLHVP